MSDMKRIWVALPADGIMRPETMYGWTTDEHIAEWRSDHEADMETGGERPLIFVEYVPADALAEVQRWKAALESIARNTCCEGCQEAALVARAALGDAG